MPPITETQWRSLESLISGLEETYSMSREVAITALVIKDQKLFQQGHPFQIPGISFEIAYPLDDESLHENDVAKIVSFLENVSIERAKSLTQQRINSGIFRPNTNH